MEQVVEISNGQVNQLINKKWQFNTIFNPRTVKMIGDNTDVNFVSIEERETLIAEFQFLKSRPIIDYNPQPGYE